MRSVTEIVAMRQVQNQLARLLARCLAVVARHVESNVARQQTSPRRIDAREHGARDHRRVGAFALGHRDRHRRLRRAALRFVRHVRRRLAEAVGDVGDVAQIDRRATARTRRRRCRLRPPVATAGTDVDLVDLIGGGELSRRQPRVRSLERNRDLARRHPARREPRGIERHAKLLRRAADDERLGDVGHGADLVLEMHGDLAQRVRVIVARQCSVSARTGTSSIECGLTSGGSAPAGAASIAPASLAWTFVTLRSWSSPTLKRTVTIAYPSPDIVYT